MQCYACNSEHCTEFLGTENLPLITYPVKEAVRNDIFEKDIQSYHCQECNHIFTGRLKPSDLELLYGNYYKFYRNTWLDTTTGVEPVLWYRIGEVDPCAP